MAFFSNNESNNILPGLSSASASPASLLDIALHSRISTTITSLTWTQYTALLSSLLTLTLITNLLYNAYLHPLHHIPGPRHISASTLWLRWQRWHGRLSLTADALLTTHGPIIRLSPNLVLLNDPAAVESVFARRDLDTAPAAIRALRVGGHDWTVTYPGQGVARQRRHPVMIATTGKNLKVRHAFFVANSETMVRELEASRGTASEDVVRHLRICTLQNAQVVVGGTGVDVPVQDFPRVLGEYNFLVVWRLCLPEWTFAWLAYSPFSHARFRVRSSDGLLALGEEICRQARVGAVADTETAEEAPLPADPNIHSLLTIPDAKFPKKNTWSEAELGAEMAGQVLAATETTSSALAFIFYELAKNLLLQEELQREVREYEGYEELDSLKLLDACIKEGLRFRPPVALTGSRLVPKGGLEVLGYYLPAGTVVTTQSLSMSRQRTDLFPDFDSFNPRRWLDETNLAEKKRLLVPFGVGSRRCPGGNMATYQMRIVLVATFRAFTVTVAPETTPEKMEPFEANGYRSQHDRCDLIFTPRTI